MRQLTFHSPDQLVWESVPDPVLSSPASALVAPTVVATCDLDAAVLASRAALPGPFPFGHEFLGSVVDVGDQVDSVRPGDTVVVPFQISCGTCARCRAGQTAHCDTVPALSSYGLGSLGGLRWGGALSELVEVPFADAMLLPIPAHLDTTHLASLSDNLPDAYRTLSGLHAGDDVLIVGAGSIGLYATALATGRGVNVTYVDRSAARCAVAAGYGAQVEHRVLDRPLSPRPYVVHTSSDPRQLRNAMLSTDRDGTCIDTGVYFTDAVPLPLLPAYKRGLTFVTGRAHVRRDIPAVLEELTTGRLDPAPVTSAVAGWADATDALRSPSTKIVLVRDPRVW